MQLVTGPTDAPPEVKAHLNVDDTDPDDVTATLVLSPNAEGSVFDPDPKLDLEPTGFEDADLSIADLRVFMSPRTILKVDAHIWRIKYIHAGGTRIFLAQFREMYSDFKHSDPDPELLDFVAQSGRTYYQFDRAIKIARLVPFVIGVAIISCALLVLTMHAAIAMFNSSVLAYVVSVILIAIYLQGPEMLVDRSKKSGPWPSAFHAIIPAIFASPFIAAIAHVPGVVPENNLLKLFIFTVGSLAIATLLKNVFEIVWWPLFGHPGAWASRTVANEQTIFYQLVHSAFMIASGSEADEVFESIHDAGETARAMHSGYIQRMLEPQDQQQMSTRGDKVAATIWHHKYLLAMPGSDERTVAQSLFNGAISVYEDNWDNLARIDPHASVKSRLQRYAPRVLVAAAIAASAFVLPIMGALPADQAGYVKSTLLVAAFFALFSSNAASLRETALSLTKDTFGKSK